MSGFKYQVPALSYKDLSVLLNQSGTDAPTATVEGDTIGVDYVVAYQGLGIYTVTFLSDILIQDKTVVSGGFYYDPVDRKGFWAERTDSATVTVYSYSGSVRADNILSFDLLEIRIYP